jgi:protein kinase
MAFSLLVYEKSVELSSKLMFLADVFQECNLYQIMKERSTPFSETEITKFCYQILQGLAYMHRNGYFHRDLKPGILLVFGISCLLKFLYLANVSGVSHL